MLSNAYFLAKFRFDTAENEPAKNLQNFRKMHFPREASMKSEKREKNNENRKMKTPVYDAFSKNAFSKNAFFENASFENAFFENAQPPAGLRELRQRRAVALAGGR